MALASLGMSIEEAARTGLVAIVDDDPSIREATLGLMRSLGLRAAAFASAEEFLRSGDLQRTDCLIADMRMSGMSGLELHRYLVAAGNAIPTILVTAYSDERLRAQSLKAGLVGCLSKPFADADLRRCIDLALARNAGVRWPAVISSAGRA